MKRTIALLLLATLLALPACGSSSPKYGTLTGEVIYFYNNFVGARADNGATVIIFNIDSYAPYPLPFNPLGDETDRGMYTATVRSDGTYTFDSLPVGKYVVLIISEHCKVFSSPKLENSITSITFGDGGGGGELQLISMLTAFRKYEVYEPVEIVADGAKTIDHDFGMTQY